MIVYSATKNKFISDVTKFNIDDIILKQFERRLGRSTGKSEIESWRDSLMYMCNILSDEEIPSDAGILVEFMIPQSSFRVDFIISGLNSLNKENVIIIELKRWSEAEITDKDGIVRTKFQGRNVETSHPSYQAWSYAAFLNSFNETIYTDDISLKPCAYLHNYVSDNKIDNSIYSNYISLAPIFLKADKQKLRDFIKKYVKKGDTKNIMFRIENGKIKPSKHLADSLGSMLKGNNEFIMIDDQKLVYETAISGSKKSNKNKKNVLIVEGGPGTGKSVVAINLLVGLNKIGKVARYVSKNSAPRTVYKTMLAGNIRGGDFDFLFTGSGSFVGSKKNEFDALIVDEAHRLNAKSGIYSHLGENQIKEIINASNFSVFFIDENQKVTTKDIGTKEEIVKWAKKFNADVRELELRSQFRCNGSNGYLAWLDNVLQIKDTANIVLEKADYNFNIVDTPSEMRDIIFELNKARNKSRMLAGYCWNWVSKRQSNKYDIVFDKFGFKHKWNLTNAGFNWIIRPDSVTEIGCIHTCQGLELENAGVIIGKDLIVRNGKVITNFNERAGSDKSLSGIVGMYNLDPAKATKIADEIIKNTYRTLLTRGMKSCYVYFVDNETTDYFKSKIEK